MVTDAERIADLGRKVAARLEEVAALRRENVALRGENARLRKDLEEWKRGHRERSRRRSSHAEGHRKPSGKKPGRKTGHAGARRPVPKPDRRVELPMPRRCECGGAVQATGEAESTIVQDIPPVRPENVEHVAHVGCCKRCGKRVVAPLPGAVGHGQSISQVQLGPEVQALILDLRYARRLTFRGISAVLGDWFGVEVTAGGVSQLIDRLRRHSVGSYIEIEQRVRNSVIVGMDETGLRQSGVMGWTWIARTEEASLFRVELSRASWVAERMLGDRFVGILCTDFYGVYTAHDDWKHSYCGAHMIRATKKIAEVEPGLFTESFRNDICGWYAEAKAKQDGSARARNAMKNRLHDITSSRPFYEHPDVKRLCTRITDTFDGIVAFLDNPALPADNNASERDIRPIAVYRKITGGTRSDNGSKSLAHWMSVTQTLRKNNMPLRRYVTDLWHTHLNGRAPPSVFASN